MKSKSVCPFLQKVNKYDNFLFPKLPNMLMEEYTRKP